MVQKSFDNAGKKTWFEEHNEHDFISLSITRTLWPELVAKITDEFEANRGPASVTVRKFHLATNMN